MPKYITPEEFERTKPAGAVEVEDTKGNIFYEIPDSNEDFYNPESQIPPEQPAPVSHNRYVPDAEFKIMEEQNALRPGHTYHEVEDSVGNIFWYERPRADIPQETSGVLETVGRSAVRGAGDLVQGGLGLVQAVTPEFIGDYAGDAANFVQRSMPDAPQTYTDPTAQEIPFLQRAALYPVETAKATLASGVQSIVPSAAMIAASGGAATPAVVGMGAVAGGRSFLEDTREAKRLGVPLKRGRATAKAIGSGAIETLTEFGPWSKLIKAKDVVDYAKATLGDAFGEGLSGAGGEVLDAFLGQDDAALPAKQRIDNLGWRMMNSFFEEGAAGLIGTGVMSGGKAVGGNILDKRMEKLRNEAVREQLRQKPVDQVMAEYAHSGLLQEQAARVAEAQGVSVDQAAQMLMQKFAADITEIQLELVEKEKDNLSDDVRMAYGMEPVSESMTITPDMMTAGPGRVAESAPALEGVVEPPTITIPPDAGAGAMTPSPQLSPMEPEAVTPSPVEAPIEEPVEDTLDDAEVDAAVQAFAQKQAPIKAVVTAVKKPRVSKSKKQQVASAIAQAPPEVQKEVVVAHIEEAQKTPDAPVTEADKAAVDAVINPEAEQDGSMTVAAATVVNPVEDTTTSQAPEVGVVEEDVELSPEEIAETEQYADMYWPYEEGKDIPSLSKANNALRKYNIAGDMLFNAINSLDKARKSGNSELAKKLEEAVEIATRFKDKWSKNYDRLVAEEKASAVKKIKKAADKAGDLSIPKKKRTGRLSMSLTPITPESIALFKKMLKGMASVFDAPTKAEVQKQLRTELPPHLKKLLEEAMKVPAKMPTKGRLSGRGTRAFGVTAFENADDVRDSWADQTVALQNSGDEKYSETHDAEFMDKKATALARTIGADPNKLKRWMAKNSLNNFAGVIVGSQMFERTLNELYKAQEAFRNDPSDENAVALSLVYNSLVLIQNTVQGYTTAASDVMNASKLAKRAERMAPDARRNALMKRVVELIGGIETVDAKNKIITDFAKYNEGNIGELIALIKKITPATTMDKLIEVRRSGLMGIGTQERNLLSNGVFMTYDQIFRRTVADVVRGKNPIPGMAGRTRGAVELFKRGMDLNAVMNGLKFAFDVMTEQTAIDTGSEYATDPTTRAVKGKVGTFARWASNAASLVDYAFKAMYDHQIAYEDAYKTAKREGLTGQKFMDRVTELVENPDEDTLVRQAFARKEGTFQLGSKDLSLPASAALDMATAASNRIKAFDLILPYKRTPANLLSMLITGTPYGLVSGINDYIKATDEFGKQRGAEQIAHALLGTSVIAIGAGLYAIGSLNPSAYKDEEERKVIDAMGGLGALKVGDFNVDLKSEDTVGGLMLLGANIAHAVATGQMKAENASALALAGATAAMQQGVQESFLYTLKQTLDIVSPRGNTDEKIYKFLRNMLYSMVVPASRTIADVATMEDPTLRETGIQYKSEGAGKATFDYVMAQIPFAKKQLTPEYGPTGQTMKKPGIMAPVAAEKSFVFDELSKIGEVPQPIEFNPTFMELNLTADELSKYNIVRRDLLESLNAMFKVKIADAAMPRRVKAVRKRIRDINKRVKRMIIVDRYKRGIVTPPKVKRDIMPSSAILMEDENE